MSSVFSAFKKALAAHLMADGGLSALVGQKVYDVPPRDERGQASTASAPFVYFGPIVYRRIEAGCGSVYETRMRLYSVSTNHGRTQAWTVHDALAAALEGVGLDLTDGHHMTDFKVMAGGDVVSPAQPRECFVDVLTNLSPASD